MSPSPYAIRVKRIYDPVDQDDGARVLVDRLWPRGMTRERAALTRHLPEVAPSADLRRWYGHDQDRFGAFARRYHDELASEPEAAAALRILLDLAAQGRLTLLTATRDLDRSHAQILLDHLSQEGR